MLSRESGAVAGYHKKQYTANGRPRERGVERVEAGRAAGPGPSGAAKAEPADWRAGRDGGECEVVH